MLVAILDEYLLNNKPPFAIVARRSRGITEPKDLEGKRLGAPPAGITFGEWPLFAKLNNIDISKVTIETIGIPVRAPMLAAGQMDAALGYSFRLYVDVKDRGVSVDDIVLMRWGLRAQALRQRIIINPKSRESRRRSGRFCTPFSRPQRHSQATPPRRSNRPAPRRHRERRGRARTPAAWPSRQHRPRRR